MNPIIPADVTPSQWGGAFTNAIFLAAGVILAGVVTYLARKYIRSKRSSGFPQQLIIIDAIVVVLSTVVASVFEVWKKGVITTAASELSAVYLALGFLLTFGILLKWLISSAKETSKDAMDELKAKNVETQKSLDLHISLEALIGSAIEHKISRLAAAIEKKLGLSEGANPEQQIRKLFQILHGYFSKFLGSGKKLRIGIYVLSDDETYLEPAQSWDGDKTDVFSGEHQKFMRLNAPGGAKSAVVQVWLQQDPFVFVANCEAAEKLSTFRFFNESQREKIKGMVAYRHNMSGDGGLDAFVITLDANDPALFTDEMEKACKVLIPAFAKRVELEHLTSFLVLNPSQETKP